MSFTKTLKASLANPFFMGYLPFSLAGVLFIVTVVWRPSSWVAVLSGGFLAVIWSAIFLILQITIFEIDASPYKRFLRLAAALSIFNLFVGVPLFWFLVAALFRLVL